MYGLGANIFDEKAVKRIFRAKGRPSDNPLIVHVGHLPMAQELIATSSKLFIRLADMYWPGPLTLVAKRNAAVLDIVTAGLDTVGIRIPASSIARDLIAEAGVPLAAPSANRSGRPSPTTAQAVLDQLDGRIFAVLDGGECSVGIESTVLDITRSAPRILRPGVVTKEMLENALGTRVSFARNTASTPPSPGMKYGHYAPRTPLYIVTNGSRDRVERTITVLRANGHRIGLAAPSQLRKLDVDAFFSLGNGSLQDFAKNLYRALQELDRKSLDVILCPAVQEIGIGLAIMNRLRKAATKIL